MWVFIAGVQVTYGVVAWGASDRVIRVCFLSPQLMLSNQKYMHKANEYFVTSSSAWVASG